MQAKCKPWPRGVTSACLLDTAVPGDGLPCTVKEALRPFAGSLQVQVLASSSRLVAFDQELDEQIQDTACGG